MGRDSQDEHIARQTALEEALASVRMEGLEPPPSFHEVAARFVNGELTIEQLIEAIHAGRKRP
jgi:Antitoxin VbhA